jgi:hypothetical protein
MMDFGWVHERVCKTDQFSIVDRAWRTRYPDLEGWDFKVWLGPLALPFKIWVNVSKFGVACPLLGVYNTGILYISQRS